MKGERVFVKKPTELLNQLAEEKDFTIKFKSLVLVHFTKVLDFLSRHFSDTSCANIANH